MTATPTKPANTAPLNSANNDYVSPSGVRVSASTYVDVPMVERKSLLNAVRNVAHASAEETPRTQSGISVMTATGGLTKLESYLGCSIDTLRQLLFQRGGLSVDLLLKLQHVTGIEVVSLKEIEEGFKAKLKLIKDFSSNNPYSNDP